MAWIKVGTCGFQKSRSAHYRYLDVLEVQQTFYDPPSPDRLEGWRREAPESFEFTVKAWMLITHEYNARLWRRVKRELKGDPSNYGGFKPTREVMEAWEETLEAARALDAKVIVFQTPRSFQPTTPNIRNLKNFITSVYEKDIVLAWEPRGAWWDHGELLAQLSQDLELLIVGDPLTGKNPYCSKSRCYYRLHGIGRGETNYSYKYTDNDLARLYERLEEYSSYVNYVLFNNIHSFDDALRFKTLTLTR